MSSWIKKNALLVYFVLAFAISWVFMIPVALSAQGLLVQSIPYALYYLAPMGPMISAITVSAVVEGREGLRHQLRGLTKWRVGFKYVAFSVLAPVALFILAVLLEWILDGEWPEWGLLGQVDYLPYLGIPGVLGLWLVTFGLGEEMGWRGFALPRLQRGRTALSATLILGLLWGLWHLPAFFFRDTYMEMGVLGLPMFLVSIIFASVVFTWLYNSTGGSVLMVILFHTFFDWLSVSETGGEYAPILMSIAVIAWALFVSRRYSTETLSPLAKHII
jgi:membrane protease YdiL (CAAX protease family)